MRDRVVEADILEVVRDPMRLASLPRQRTTDLFSRARNSGMLGRIAARAFLRDKMHALPERIQGVLESAITAASAFQRMPRFETDRIRRALAPLEIDVILLKGSAYAMCGLPAALGRSLSDVDILVPRTVIDRAEGLLRAAGWEQVKTSEYDQMYFRKWMHELPPMRHVERRTFVDLHHTILPLTGRLRPDPALLIAASVPVPGLRGVRVLAPADMVLHNVVHHFQDGEFQHSLRELVDLDDLVRHFNSLPNFWDTVIARTETFGFGRPAYYAFRHAMRLLDTPVPQHVTKALDRYAPPAPIRAIMDSAITSCLLASGRLPKGPKERVASKVLYGRAQWLKMPPTLLARHTLAKMLNSLPWRQPATKVGAELKPSISETKA